ncbi:hypothetical protein VTO42DRAFT_990 [Malbranchea cinnamomea]
MKGLEPSFGAHACAAELDAATAAKASNGAVGVPNKSPSKMFTLQCAPRAADARPTLDHAGMRNNSRVLSFSSSASKVSSHPLRTVATFDASTGDKPMVVGARRTVGSQGTSSQLNRTGFSLVERNLSKIGFCHPLLPTSKNVPDGPRVMLPGDISPAKQEEKFAYRFRNAMMMMGMAPDGDPFVSNMPGFAVSDQDNHCSYDINMPPGPMEQGFAPRYAHNSVYPQQSRSPGYADLHSHAKPSSLEHDYLSYLGTAAVSQVSMRRPNSFQTPTAETQRTLVNCDTAMGSSMGGMLSTPTRGANFDSSEQPKLYTSNHDYKGNQLFYDDSPCGAANLHSRSGLSRSLGNTPASRLTQETLPVSTRLLLQLQEQHPILRAICQSSAQDPTLQNEKYLNSTQAASSTRRDQPLDMFAHLDHGERPVPWLVAPADAEDFRMNVTDPPPAFGRLVRPPGQEHIVRRFAEFTPQNHPANREARTRSDSDLASLEHLRARIQELALEERGRRLKAGSNEAVANNAADWTVLLGHTLVSLQSYVVGDPKKQCGDFANFGDVPDYAVEENKDGKRSFFDNDPLADQWRLPPPREPNQKDEEENVD